MKEIIEDTRADICTQQQFFGHYCLNILKQDIKNLLAHFKHNEWELPVSQTPTDGACSMV